MKQNLFYISFYVVWNELYDVVFDAIIETLPYDKIRKVVRVTSHSKTLAGLEKLRTKILYISSAMLCNDLAYSRLRGFSISAF